MISICSLQIRVWVPYILVNKIKIIFGKLLNVTCTVRSTKTYNKGVWRPSTAFNSFNYAIYKHRGDNFIKASAFTATLPSPDWNFITVRQKKRAFSESKYKFTFNHTCQGQAPGLAFWPPMTRDWTMGVLPQGNAWAEVKKYSRNYLLVIKPQERLVKRAVSRKSSKFKQWKQ